MSSSVKGPVPAVASAASDPPVLARRVIHDVAFRWFETMPRGRVLDVPSGAGALSLRLQRAGFEVDSCDVNADGFQAAGPRFTRGDLCQLPYPDGAFDYAACIEGPEHLENP